MGKRKIDWNQTFSGDISLREMGAEIENLKKEVKRLQENIECDKCLRSDTLLEDGLRKLPEWMKEAMKDRIKDIEAGKVTMNHPAIKREEYKTRLRIAKDLLPLFMDRRKPGDVMGFDVPFTPEDCAKAAVEYADALIDELKKRKDEEED